MTETDSPPLNSCYMVVFCSQRTPGDQGYDAMAERMVTLAERQNGFLGAESVRDASGTGITVSYWRSLEDIERWKAHAEHREAQRLGQDRWYSRFRLTVARVERDQTWMAP